MAFLNTPVSNGCYYIAGLGNPGELGKLIACVGKLPGAALDEYHQWETAFGIVLHCVRHEEVEGQFLIVI